MDIRSKIKSRLLRKRPAPVFTGALRRLVVVAGPRGCGKTTFMHHSSRFISPECMPKELSDISRFGPAYIPLKRLPEQPAEVDTLWLQVDITTPAADLPVISSKDLLERFHTLYESWPLLQCIRQAEEIHFLTFCTDRSVTFRRFFDRSIEIRPTLKSINKNTINIYGPDRQSKKLYSTMHEAWFNYIRSLNGKSYWTIDANSSPYTIHSGNHLPGTLKKQPVK